jgi:hypothetical protein
MNTCFLSRSLWLRWLRFISQRLGCLGRTLLQASAIGGVTSDDRHQKTYPMSPTHFHILLSTSLSQYRFHAQLRVKGSRNTEKNLSYKVMVQ